MGYTFNSIYFDQDSEPENEEENEVEPIEKDKDE